MKGEFAKQFSFSASYSTGTRSIGRNFTLQVTTGFLDEERERALDRIVHRELIAKLHTQDLNRQSRVLKLKESDINDTALLKAFWRILSKPLKPYGIKRLSLQRDSRSVTTLSK